MKLTYRILWFENESSWVESIEDEVKEILDENGLELETCVLEQEQEGFSYNNFDLILMDLNLAAGSSGDLLINSIRAFDVYTNVLFYSADGLPVIKQKAYRLGLEGVYFASRDKDSFLEKLRKVIRTTISKAQDLNNLRGLVMAEVSDLDVMMGEIVQRYLSQTKENLDRFHCKITRDLEKSLRKRLNKGGVDGATCKKDCTHVWRDANATVTDIVSSVEFESSKKARAVNLVIKDYNFPYTSQSGNFFEDYRTEIIDVRNKLAHCKSEIVNGKEVLIARDGSKEEFGFDRFIKIRRDIKRFRDLFKKI